MPKQQKIIKDPTLGEIKLTKYKASKYLRIKIDRPYSLKISLPSFVSYQSALDFLEEKREWVLQQYSTLKNRSSMLQSLDTSFSTKFRKLELIPCDLSKATYRLSSSLIKIYYPQNLEPQNDSVAVVIKTAIEDALRREAHIFLPKRLSELAKKHNLKFKKIFIRNTRTRWGSCSSENNINLCIHLMKLPDELIDYVLLHELAHTVEKNHSKNFWDLLTRLLGQDSKSLDKRLKAYRTELFMTPKAIA